MLFHVIDQLLEPVDSALLDAGVALHVQVTVGGVTEAPPITVFVFNTPEVFTRLPGNQRVDRIRESADNIQLQRLTQLHAGFHVPAVELICPALGNHFVSLDADVGAAHALDRTAENLAGGPGVYMDFEYRHPVGLDMIERHTNSIFGSHRWSPRDTAQPD